MAKEDIKKKRFGNVNEYIQAYPQKVKDILRKIRAIVKEEAPQAEEIISYNMPAYKIYGRILLYFAAHTEHIGVYALPSANIEFKKELYGYETSKGTVKFPFSKPIPYELVGRMVKFRAKENMKKR